ncbi:glycoside hydrolase family 55 protein [Bacteroidales bacterium OttesenSCG-928-I21]|nr:glycoside hydrolase family 55 protein [Bacteroidales bacterium OttesenSCG-928-I21]
MKSSKLVFLSLFLLNATFLFAQQKVALHSNGTTTIFGGAQPFTDAYNASVTGDTIYLPGGSLVYPTNITKGLVIYGAGHYPDSTQATGKTVLNGGLTININADNLYLEGIELTGGLNFATNVKIDNVVLRRCRFGNIHYVGNASPCENSQIIQCVIDGNITLSNAKSSTISNCFIGGQIGNGSEMAILNNVFFYNNVASFRVFTDLKNSSVSNNIFLRRNRPDCIQSGCSVVFSNNVFKDAATDIDANNSDINNYKGVDIDELFINQSGQAFDYSHDYHLLSPATYPGTDGTQVGVYGGLFPYKAAAVPVNPHISTKLIAPQTNNEGELQIEINVNAQNE